MKFEHVDTDIIGDTPNKETYELYQGSGKMMELVFFENSNRYEIYIQNLKDGEKITGETTELFKIMVEKMQLKANELNQTVTLMFDPVNENIKNWARIKAPKIIGEWDEVMGDGRKFYKRFYPKN